MSFYSRCKGPEQTLAEQKFAGISPCMFGFFQKVLFQGTCLASLISLFTVMCAKLTLFLSKAAVQLLLIWHDC